MTMLGRLVVTRVKASPFVGTVQFFSPAFVVVVCGVAFARVFRNIWVGVGVGLVMDIQEGDLEPIGKVKQI